MLFRTMLVRTVFLRSTFHRSKLTRSLGALTAAMMLTFITGCANRPHAWGFPGGQGTIERQKARAAVHDPYPLNDIGPEVVGGRPREFYNPQAEVVRQRNVETLPPGFGY